MRLFFILVSVMECLNKKVFGCCGLQVLRGKLNAMATWVDLIDIENSEALTCEMFIWFGGFGKAFFPKGYSPLMTCDLILDFGGGESVGWFLVCSEVI